MRSLGRSICNTIVNPGLLRFTSSGSGSRQHLFHHVSRHIRQTEIAAQVVISQSRVLQPQAVPDLVGQERLNGADQIPGQDHVRIQGHLARDQVVLGDARLFGIVHGFTSSVAVTIICTYMGPRSTP